MLHRWQPLPSKNDATRRSAATVRRTSNQSSRPSISTFDGHRVLGALTLAARTGAGPSNSRYYGARISTRRSRWAEPPPGPSSGWAIRSVYTASRLVEQRPAGALCPRCSPCRTAADNATCEHHRNRAGEAVLLGLNFGAGEHLLQDSISDTLCDERMDRFHT